MYITFAPCFYTFMYILGIQLHRALTNLLFHFAYFAYSYEKIAFINYVSVSDRHVQQITPTTQQSKGSHKNKNSRDEIDDKNSSIHLDRLQNKCTNCNGFKKTPI